MLLASESKSRHAPVSQRHFRTTCIIFLSLRYHLQFPNYVGERIAALHRCARCFQVFAFRAHAHLKRRNFQLRVVLLWIDQESHLLHGVLNQLSAMGLERRFSLIPAWNKHEAARYIESYKFYERTNADLIRGRVAPDFPTRLASALTQIKSVNKSDVKTLNNQIGSLADIANATLEELLVCRGLGATKAKRLHAAMRRPLSGAATATTATANNGATIPSLLAAQAASTTAASTTKETAADVIVLD